MSAAQKLERILASKGESGIELAIMTADRTTIRLALTNEQAEALICQLDDLLAKDDA